MISVIVPVYRQEKTIEDDVKNIEKSLAALGQEFEIVVVVDGSPDASYEKARRLESAHVKIYSYNVNKGKGYALRYGAVRARGEVIVFLEAGMEINPRGIGMLWEHLKWYQADIVIGSKRHPASMVNYPPTRKIMSFFTSFLSTVFLG